MSVSVSWNAGLTGGIYAVSACGVVRFRATLYPCPETQAERREMSLGVMTRIEDLNTVTLVMLSVFISHK